MRRPEKQEKPSSFHQMGNFYGMPVLQYEHKKGQYEDAHLVNLLQIFKANTSLGLIGMYAHGLIADEVEAINRVPLSHDALAYIAMRVIEETDDTRSKNMRPEDLANAIDHYRGTIDSFANKVEDVELVRKMAGASFKFNFRHDYALTRTLILYEELWNTVNEAKSLDYSVILRDETDMTLRQIIGWGFLFWIASKRGYISEVPFDGANGNELDRHFGMTKESQVKFLKWISINYESFRMLTQKSKKACDLTDEPFRFNPLTVKPVVTSDESPMDDNSKGFLVPSPMLLIDRVTNNLYHVLSKKFEKDEGNAFRIAFGKVFEQYVGNLLKASLEPRAQVIPEVNYGPKGHQGKCPDWFIVRDDRLVEIEVKQAGLYLSAKLFGRTDDIRKDIKHNIVEALLQFVEFEKNIPIYPELAKFKKCHSRERLIVLFDPVYFPNAFLRNDIQEVLKSEGIVLPVGFHYSIISIQSLENFLGIPELNLSRSLEIKRTNQQYNTLDFQEFTKYQFPDFDQKNHFLDAKADYFFKQFQTAFQSFVESNPVIPSNS